MKTQSLVFLFLVQLNLYVLSQDYIHTKIIKDPYVARIQFLNSKEMKKGYLNALNDSSIVLSEISDPKMDRSLTVGIEKIEEIQLRRNDNPSVGQYTFRGFLIGAGLGILVGIASGDDHGSFFSFSATDKALLLGVGMGAWGAGIGLAIGISAHGSAKIRIPIYGKKSNYESGRKTLKKYTY